MKYADFPADLRNQCQKVRVKKDLMGGRIKKGQIIYSYHKFRIFIPAPNSGAEPTTAAGFEFDVQLFHDYFEPVVDTPKAVTK